MNSNSYNILWWGSIAEVVYVKLTKDYNSLRRLALVSSQRPSSLMAPFLAIEIQKKITELYKAEMDFVYYLNKAYEDKEYLIYLDFLKRLAKMHWLWCYNNSQKGNP